MLTRREQLRRIIKQKKDAAQRVVELNKTLLPTSVTYSGAILSNAKIPRIFDIPTFMDENHSAPVNVIHNNISTQELMALFGVNESDARDMQEEIKQGKAGGGYSRIFKNITIFADSIIGQ